MAIRHAVDDPDLTPSRCWCCGAVEAPHRLVHLGNHPEVALCVRCAHWVSKQAWEIEDLTRTGPLVRTRHRLRAVRRHAVEKGWHRSRLVGGPLRWLGKHLP